MSQAIKDFQKGQMSSSDFIMKLRDNEVQIDDKLSTLIKKQEAGDT